MAAERKKGGGGKSTIRSGLLYSKHIWNLLGRKKDQKENKSLDKHRVVAVRYRSAKRGPPASKPQNTTRCCCDHPSILLHKASLLLQCSHASTVGPRLKLEKGEQSPIPASNLHFPVSNAPQAPPAAPFPGCRPVPVCSARCSLNPLH